MPEIWGVIQIIATPRCAFRLYFPGSHYFGLEANRSFVRDGRKACFTGSSPFVHCKHACKH